ncbi:FAD-dependent oxidoreductase [Streptomyces sp. GbtcB7]|uniref:FAD-dependent oxidoreductase n=1 Tax=Streptomyces sp. GbtcB7 TaxID=2824752 RepID=UPI001C3035E0|nr:FAD-dependent oxidoreductase [Streptomyces sp. GbtcB7]
MEVLRGSQAPARTLLRPAATWSTQDIELLTGTTIADLDTAARKITLEDATHIPYHRQLLPTGSQPRRRPGTRGLRQVHYLRTLADTQALRGALITGGSLWWSVPG